MAISGGIGGIGLLPAFALPRPEGGCVHSWGYKGRAALVIWILADRPPSDPALVACAESYPRLRDEQAELLVVQVGPPEALGALSTRLPGVLLVDLDGSTHRRLAAAGPTLLMADRDGAIYWRSPIEDVPDFAEASAPRRAHQTWRHCAAPAELDGRSRPGLRRAQGGRRTTTCLLHQELAARATGAHRTAGMRTAGCTHPGPASSAKSPPPNA